MSLLYNLIFRKNPLKPQEKAKLYISLRTMRMAKIDEVVTKIRQYNNIPEDICRAVLNAWNKVAIEFLTNGISVELGDAGYVYLTASSGGAEDKEEATVDLVKKINGRICFSPKAKTAFNEAGLINVGTLTSGINTPQQAEEENG